MRCYAKQLKHVSASRFIGVEGYLDLVRSVFPCLIRQLEDSADRASNGQYIELPHISYKCNFLVLYSLNL